MAICGSRDWTSVSSMMFRVPPACSASALEAPVEAAVEAAVELEPPQAVRPELLRIRLLLPESRGAKYDDRIS